MRDIDKVTRFGRLLNIDLQLGHLVAIVRHLALVTLARGPVNDTAMRCTSNVRRDGILLG
jgi:hypothetical protein